MPISSRLPLVLAGAGFALLPWVVVLALVPGSLGWIALDLAEAACLLGSALLLRRGHAARRPLAALAALLLVGDAWCDVSTAGSSLLVAVAMAVCAELPLAALCSAIALRGRTVPAAAPRPELALALAA
ncbi:hypothetical protein [Kitasatospora azatica]|uniref:hypothetical protein n=1 Tax=Kitasatospora azatica TaxID=58347 RepID=UPI00068FE0F9|nr:hypothetical protein [Kitasatospora azatica]